MSGVLATLACQRKKREDCPCPPCAARRDVFGSNIPVQLQEPRRAALAAGLITSLKEKAPDE